MSFLYFDQNKILSQNQSQTVNEKIGNYVIKQSSYIDNYEIEYEDGICSVETFSFYFNDHYTFLYFDQNKILLQNQSRTVHEKIGNYVIKQLSYINKYEIEYDDGVARHPVDAYYWECGIPT